MDEITCNGCIDTENKKIIISGINEKDIEINFNGDIDFTNLVSILTEKIDNIKIINFIIDAQTDEKLILIVETLKSIFDSYNESISDDEEDTNESEENHLN